MGTDKVETKVLSDELRKHPHAVEGIRGVVLEGNEITKGRG